MKKLKKTIAKVTSLKKLKANNLSRRSSAPDVSLTEPTKENESVSWQFVGENSKVQDQSTSKQMEENKE